MEPAPREQNTHDQSKLYSRAKPERRRLGGLLRIPDEASGHAWRDTIRDALGISRTGWRANDQLTCDCLQSAKMDEHIAGVYPRSESLGVHPAMETSRPIPVGALSERL
jgi:hypothetical protein